MAAFVCLTPDDAIRREISQLEQNYWDFSSANTKEWTHGYHPYPAMMIPQVARSLIHLILKHQPRTKRLFDPFMGSGTSLVEGLVAGLEVTGSDLNPLSHLLASVKTRVWDPDVLQTAFAKIVTYYRSQGVTETDWPQFENLLYWFKPPVIDDLTRLKKSIEGCDEEVRAFFWVAFSATVRHVSNSRNQEFKLYRLDEKRLALWNPDVLETFGRIVQRNLLGNKELWQRQPLPSVRLLQDNAMDLRSVEDSSVDLMLTSPPYGDSRTTVAYGQFSRLSLQWLNLPADSIEPHRVDQSLLGGKTVKAVNCWSLLPSPTLNQALSVIAQRDSRRARDVLAFYLDLDRSLKEIARVMRPGGFQCWVVGNRRVKEVQLRTDQMICELSEPYGLSHVATIRRRIPNKRMPKENSPTNRTGQKAETMTEEHIVILRKE
ncbi:hypothetical protein [Sulfobacillus thermosulfidooxidans]|uniref:hypothetical protein n=1 Tax=Sulfobacillus thermosulfidooxidans TaxID=28034 RepID=UPI0006B4F7AC|nr:hypothetical protein [Sulfobacillus thermosulfidooxidans]